MSDDPRRSFDSPPPGVDGPVTTTVTRRVKPGHEAFYEQFLTGINAAASQFPGHLGVEVFRPESATAGEYRIVYRFDTGDHLRAWLDSDERAAWLQRAEPHVIGPMRTRFVTGLESWFTLPDRPSIPPPPPYKMALLTWITIFGHVEVTGETQVDDGAPSLDRQAQHAGWRPSYGSRSPDWAGVVVALDPPDAAGRRVRCRPLGGRHQTGRLVDRRSRRVRRPPGPDERVPPMAVVTQRRHGWRCGDVVRFHDRIKRQQPQSILRTTREQPEMVPVRRCPPAARWRRRRRRPAPR